MLVRRRGGRSLMLMRTDRVLSSIWGLFILPLLPLSRCLFFLFLLLSQFCVQFYLSSIRHHCPSTIDFTIHLHHHHRIGLRLLSPFLFARMSYAKHGSQSLTLYPAFAIPLNAFYLSISVVLHHRSSPRRSPVFSDVSLSFHSSASSLRFLSPYLFPALIPSSTL